MSVFQDITFEFDGEQYKVEAGNVLKLLANLYDIVHPSDVLSEKPNLPKLAEAFAECINYCGGSVTADQVYGKMFDPSNKLNTPDVVGSLMLLIVPPSQYQTAQASEDDVEKKTQSETP